MTERKLRQKIRHLLLTEAPEDLEKALETFAQDPETLRKDAEEWLDSNYTLDDDAKGVAVKSFQGALNRIHGVARVVKSPGEQKFFDDQTGKEILNPDKRKKAEEGTAQATPEEVDEDLEEIEGGMAEFEATLEKTIEKAYKAEDTPEFKELEKALSLFKRYVEFFKKLIDMIMNFAKKRERQDVVDLTQGNLQIVLSWIGERSQYNEEQMKKEFGDDYDDKEVINGQPTQRQMAAVLKMMQPLIKDLKKIIVTLKKDPLKKLNKNNLLESVRSDMENLIVEKRLRAQIRRILRERR